MKLSNQNIYNLHIYIECKNLGGGRCQMPLGGVQIISGEGGRTPRKSVPVFKSFHKALFFCVP